MARPTQEGAMLTPEKSRGRKPSFKTKAQHDKKITYRTTKVTLLSNKVASLASKFDSAAPDDDAKTKVLKRAQARGVKHRAEGSVKNAIQQFEKFNQKPKVGRSNSGLPKKKTPKTHEPVHPQSEKMKYLVDPKKSLPNELNTAVDLSLPSHDTAGQRTPKSSNLMTSENVPSNLYHARHCIVEDVNTIRIPDSKEPKNATERLKEKPPLHPKPTQPKSFLFSHSQKQKKNSSEIYKSIAKENVLKEKKLSIPKNISILESALSETSEPKPDVVIQPNSSFLWGSLGPKDKRASEPKDKENSSGGPEPGDFETLSNEKNTLNLLETANANKSSLYRNLSKPHLGKAYESVDVTELSEKPPELEIIKSENEFDSVSLHRYEDIDNFSNKGELNGNYESVYYETENSYDVIGGHNEEAIYDVVMHPKSEEIYESIDYKGPAQHDSDSSCEQNNSLYDMRPPSRTSVYSGTNPEASRSDTSDDWVDLEVDGSEEVDQVIVVRERARNRNASSGWSQNVRRQWSKRGADFNAPGDDSDESKCYEAIEQPDDSHFDDFDDSDSEVYSAKSPSQAQENTQSVPNEGIYGRMRQAGKKVYNSWSIGKSLRKISNFTSHQNINGLVKADINRGKWSSFKRRLSSKSNSTFYLSPATPPNEQNTKVKKNENQSRLQPALLKTEGSVPDVRRLSVSVRPSSPPPPPPPLNHIRTNNDLPELKEPPHENSIYGGSDIYDLGSIASEKSVVNRYSDMGLYENSQSFDSQSDHGSDLSLKFPDEPLYQFYTAIVNNFDRDVIGSEVRFDELSLPESEAPLRPSALDLVSPEFTRTLWCQVPQVVSSGILDTLSTEKKRLQEAKFELLTSEASYYKSLMILEKHFMGSALLKNDATISKVDYKTLFGNVTSVRKCSEKVLSVLEQCWQDSILMEGICERVYQVAQDHFSTYVKYCANQVLIEKTMKNLKGTNPNFHSALKVLHSSKECHGLSLYSFLLLPMQRITRMPLLLDAILTKLTPSDSEYEQCQLTLALVNKIVHDCDEAAKKTERYEEMAIVSNILHFPNQIRPLPLHSASRWLIRSGQVVHINPDAKLTLSRKLTSSKNTKFTMFLFNDYLIIAKKKSEDHFIVHSYCQRRFAEMKKPDDIIISTKYLVQLTILENHEGKTQEMVFCCGSESSRERWIDAFCPPTSGDPDEKVYSSWDCPQYVATHVYVPSQPDELSLQTGDVVNVERKLNDGWFYGERNRDGEKGWFPGNYTTEIQSEHARARNLKQRHRLLVLSGNYLQQQQAQQQQNRRSIFY